MASGGRTEGCMDGRMEGRTDGHRQTYIPPPSAGDNIQYLNLPTAVHYYTVDYCVNKTENLTRQHLK